MVHHFAQRLAACSLFGCPPPISAPPTDLGECFFLTPWLSEFHEVWFSGTSCSSLFLSWLLSFFCFCEEVKHFYLHLHLGWNLDEVDFICKAVVTVPSSTRPMLSSHQHSCHWLCPDSSDTMLPLLSWMSSCLLSFPVLLDKFFPSLPSAF